MAWAQNNVVTDMTLTDNFTNMGDPWTVTGSTPSGCSIEYSTDYSLHGSSLHVHVSAGAGTFSVLSPTFTVSNWHQRMYLRYYSTSVFPNCEIYVGTPLLTKNFNRTYVTKTGLYGWNTMSLGGSWILEGSPGYADDARKIKIKFYQGASDYDIYISDVYLGGMSKATLVFSWDDGTPDHYSVVAPAFENRGMRCTFFTYPPGWVGYITVEQALDLHSRGFDLEGHGDVKLTDIHGTDDLLNYLENRTQWSHDLDIPVEHFAYPSGEDSYADTKDSNTIPRALNSMGFKSARRTAGGFFEPSKEFYFPEAPYHIPALSMMAAGSGSTYLSTITNGIVRNGGTLFMFGHIVRADEGATGFDINLSTLEYVLDGILPYVNNGLLTVKTVKQWYNDLYTMPRRARS